MTNYDSDYSVRLATLAALGGDTTERFSSVYDVDIAILDKLKEGVGVKIDDTDTSTGTTWSSAKIFQELTDAGFNVQVVEELPETGEDHTIYFVPKDGEQEKNIYDEYLYVDGKWEKIGDTEIDLSEYAKIADVDASIKVVKDQVDALDASLVVDESVIAEAFVEQKTSITNLQNNKQDKLVSGTNIKTINGASLLASGDIELPTKSYVANNYYNKEEIQSNESVIAEAFNEVKDEIPTDYVSKAKLAEALMGYPTTTDVETMISNEDTSIKEYISSLPKDFEYKIVDALPADGSNNVLYFIPKNASLATSSNAYDEYMYLAKTSADEYEVNDALSVGDELEYGEYYALWKEDTGCSIYAEDTISGEVFINDDGELRYSGEGASFWPMQYENDELYIIKAVSEAIEYLGKVMSGTPCYATYIPGETTYEWEMINDDLSIYATLTWVKEQNFDIRENITSLKTQVKNCVTNASLNASLAHYATIDYVNELVSSCVEGDGITYMWALTQAEYDEIEEKDPTTFYIITDASSNSSSSDDAALTSLADDILS